MSSPPPGVSVSAGENVSFTLAATGSPPLSYQWRLHGTNLPGATNATLPLSNVQPVDTGTYDVEVSNPAGLAASPATDLTVTQPASRFVSITVLTNGQAQLLFGGAPGQQYVLDGSTDLADWLPISVLAISNGPLPFLDPEAASFTTRFYRAREATSHLLTDFEAYTVGSQVMFQPPTASGSTGAYLDATPNIACVMNAFPPGHASVRVDNLDLSASARADSRFHRQRSAGNQHRQGCIRAPRPCPRGWNGCLQRLARQLPCDQSGSLTQARLASQRHSGARRSLSPGARGQLPPIPWKSHSG